jgi:hypothetical protein
MSIAIGCRDVFPKFLTGHLASVANDIGDNLPGGTTSGDPYPPFVDMFQDA